MQNVTEPPLHYPQIAPGEQPAAPQTKAAKTPMEGRRDPRKSPQRHKANREKIILWTYKWGWISEKILQKLLAIKLRSALTWCDRGVLRQVKIRDESGNIKIRYILTTEVLREAEELYVGISSLRLDYPWTSRAIPKKHLHHHAQAQLCALDAINGGDIRRVLSERELQVQQPTARAQPDFCILDDQDRPVWHETELSAKSGARLLYQIQERTLALTETHAFATIVWHCGSGRVRRVLEETMAADSILRAGVNNKYEKVIITDETGIDPRPLGRVSCYVPIVTREEAGTSDDEADIDTVDADADPAAMIASFQAKIQAQQLDPAAQRQQRHLRILAENRSRAMIEKAEADGVFVLNREEAAMVRQLRDEVWDRERLLAQLEANDL